MATSTSATCPRLGCGRPSWNDQAGSHCSKICRDAGEGSAAQCARPSCLKLSWNGKVGQYCGKSCRGLLAGASCQHIDKSHGDCCPIPVIVIGITGASRCGKGWVSGELRNKLGLDPSAVVGQDNFFKGMVQVTTPKGKSVKSAEEPECQDHVKFGQAIQSAMQNALALPHCAKSCGRLVYPGYASCCKTCATSGGTKHEQFCNERCAGKHPAVVIAEGFKLVHDASVLGLLTHVFLLDLNEAECIKRRCSCKDPKLNPRPIPESEVREVLWPAHDRYVKASVDPLVKAGRIQSFAAPSTDAQVAVIVDSICKQLGLP